MTPCRPFSAAVVAALALAAVSCGRAPALPSLSTTSPSSSSSTTSARVPLHPAEPAHHARRARTDDGVVPDGVTVFDDRFPAVARLRPALLHSLRRAARAAAASGITVYVNSGWRDASYQEQLLREAISTYGSAGAAARWVATATTSPHVSGDAVDLGRPDATRWLSEHGAAYGLCRIYRNEPWHFELRPRAVTDGCPAPYADPTHDPRMQP